MEMGMRLGMGRWSDSFAWRTDSGYGSFRVSPATAELTATGASSLFKRDRKLYIKTHEFLYMNTGNCPETSFPCMATLSEVVCRHLSGTNSKSMDTSSEVLSNVIHECERL